jgi:hypothetical protein
MWILGRTYQPNEPEKMKDHHMVIVTTIFELLRVQGVQDSRGQVIMEEIFLISFRILESSNP